MSIPDKNYQICTKLITQTEQGWAATCSCFNCPLAKLIQQSHLGFDGSNWLLDFRLAWNFY